MEQVWQFTGSAKKGEPLEIHGVNVWSQGWQAEGEEVQVNDPVYGKTYVFQVFSILDDNEKVKFAAGEFSDGLWGFYTSE